MIDIHIYNQEKYGKSRLSATVEKSISVDPQTGIKLATVKSTSTPYKMLM